MDIPKLANIGLTLSGFPFTLSYISFCFMAPLLSYGKLLIAGTRGMPGLTLTTCGRYGGLSKVAAKKFAYEIQNLIQPPGSKLKMAIPGNPKSQEIFAGRAGHCTALMNFSGTGVLTDPVFSRGAKTAGRAVDLPLESEDINNLLRNLHLSCPL